MDQLDTLKWFGEDKRKVRSSEYIPGDQHMETVTLANRSGAEDVTTYPPEGEDLKKVVDNISKHKCLPAELPDNLRKQISDYPRCFFPEENFCTIYPGTVPLSNQILITARAKILTIDGVVNGTASIIYTFVAYKEVIHVVN